MGAVAAVAVGLLALSMIGDDLTSRTAQPLSQDTVARWASAAPDAAAPSASTGSSEPAPAPSPSSPAGAGALTTATPAAAPAAQAGDAGVETVASSPGGTAIARCAGGQVYLVSWSPEQGYRTDDVARGPAAVVSVKFESDANKVVLSVRCVDGEPRPAVSQRADDHGGRDKKSDDG